MTKKHIHLLICLQALEAFIQQCTTLAENVFLQVSGISMPVCPMKQTIRI